ncbi:MAG: hypothetical protein Q8S21_03720 [Candidatus Paracaedibacteraceae bacterium]|nr:hypothetical protein [Candidatus Paracaedibacteraceae bacterium]
MQKVRTYKNDQEEVLLQSYTQDNACEDTQAIISTSTGESYLMARVFYKFRVAKDLIKQLNKCHCVDFYTPTAFHISYVEEMERSSNLSVAAKDVPEDIYPIVLARGTIHDSGALTIDVQSLPRIQSVYRFMKKHVKAAYITAVGMHTQYSYKLPTDIPNSLCLDQLVTFDFNTLFAQASCDEALKKAKDDLLIESEDLLNSSTDGENSALNKSLNESTDLTEFFPMDATSFSDMRLGIKIAMGEKVASDYHELKAIPTKGDVLASLLKVLQAGEKGDLNEDSLPDILNADSENDDHGLIREENELIAA